MVRRQLSGCLEWGGDWSEIPNLLYIDRRSCGEPEIRQTPYRRLSPSHIPEVTRRTEYGEEKTFAYKGVSPAELANVRLFPGETCFWRKCAFCGINAKYPQPLCATSKEGLWPVDGAADCLAELERTGVRYFWSIRPLAKLNKAVKIADTSDQGKAKSKTFSTVTISL